MPLRDSTDLKARASLGGWGRHLLSFALPVAWLVLCTVVLLSPLAGKTPPASGVDPDYVSALAAADHLLHDWQSGDAENGMVLLSGHAKQSAGADAVEKFFANTETSAYEIARGKMVRSGRYEFPVVLMTGGLRSRRARRRFSSVVVVNTGNNDWAVDKLP